jgi:aldehyde:ferredoxin oxidoreductase
MNDKGRAAGRSGVGAVMDEEPQGGYCHETKGLKIANRLRLHGLLKKNRDKAGERSDHWRSHHVRYGGTVSYMNMVGMLPTNNFQMGVFSGRRLWMA